MRRIRSYGRGNGDSGAVLVLVVLCVSIALLGVSALVINTGFWYGERAQLQNGADSAAIAVAKSCAQGTCNQAIATTEANNNANDGLTTVDMICGTTPGVTSPLAPCTPYQQNGSYCPPAPAAASSFVNVHTVTPATQAIPVFGKLTGTSKQINACAQAAYGFPGSGDVAPFTLSACEFYYATGATGNPPTGAVFANKPTYTSAAQLPNAYPAGPGNKYNPDVSPALTRPSEIVVPLHGTANLLQGGSFDTGTDGWTARPSGNGGPQIASVLASNGFPTFNGTAGSLQVTWGTGNSATPVAASTISISQNQMNNEGYTLTGWVYATSTTGQPRIAAYSNDPTVTVNDPTRAANRGAPVTLVANTWTQISVSFTATSNSNTVGITNVDPITSGTTFYMDEFSLEPTVNPQCAGTPQPTNPPSGFDMSGGFGWISDPNGCANITISVGNTAWDNTGQSLPSGCNSVLSSHTCSAATIIASCQPSPIYVPVYDYVCNNNNGCDITTVCGANKPPGSNGCYHFVAFAAFIPTGFNLNGGGGLNQNSFISNKGYCSGSSKCVYGYYTAQFGQLPNGQGGGPNFGLSFYSLSG